MNRRDFVLLLTGALLATLLIARVRPRRIGFFCTVSADCLEPQLTVFRQALNETGYAQGRNLAIEYDFADGHYTRLRY
jgi:putative ABC transport system substrate-binding protein